ncbi:MAG: hypothetical protein IT200_17915 [Thermoleophilia bacterium]|nr:hypothetical protein [Thermoleophilia bacterium]
MAREVTFSDMAHDPAEVARGLVAWQRGDADEAVRQTLAASARETHGRSYTLWVWAGGNGDGVPVWLLPVTAAQAEAFAPRGPAAVLVRSIGAAVVAGAEPQGIRVLDWEGWTCLEVPGADAELAPLALTEQHPDAGRVAVATLPAGMTGDAPEVELPSARPGQGTGLVEVAAAVDAHPLEVAIALAARGQPVEGPGIGPELVVNLRNWGLSGEPQEEITDPGYGIDDDPCPRRRHARRVLQRLLRMGKVGTGYHTAFDHMYRGAPADQRHDALEVGEALLRAGLLGEKPSVGQRHVYLRREALPEIHALIDRGETADPGLASMWTAPAPGTTDRG